MFCSCEALPAILCHLVFRSFSGTWDFLVGSEFWDEGKSLCSRGTWGVRGEEAGAGSSAGPGHIPGTARAWGTQIPRWFGEKGWKHKKNNWFLFRLTDPWLWRKKEFRPETEKCLANPKSAKRSMTTLKTFPRAAPLTPPPSPDTCPPSATFHLSVTPATCWLHRHRCILHPASPLDLTILPVWSLPWVSERLPCWMLTVSKWDLLYILAFLQACGYGSDVPNQMGGGKNELKKKKVIWRRKREKNKKKNQKKTTKSTKKEKKKKKKRKKLKKRF